MSSGKPHKFLQDRRLWVITFLVFAVLITFFDKSNLIEQWKLRQSINELEQQKEYYQEKIAADSVTMVRLKDDDFLEHYAREHYRMKREGEEIYVIQK